MLSIRKVIIPQDHLVERKAGLELYSHTFLLQATPVW